MLSTGGKFTMPFDHNMTVKESADKFKSLHPSTESYRFFLPTGENLNDADKIADVLRAFCKDQYQLRFGPPLKHITVSSESHVDIVGIELDFNLPLVSHVSRLCRKLGERIHLVKGIQLATVIENLDTSKSLKELNVAPSAHLLVVTEPVNSPAPLVVFISNNRTIMENQTFGMSLILRTHFKWNQNLCQVR
jgi:hypothetical protein